MIPRIVERLVSDRLATTPAVALVGPRQAGKTTLARSIGLVYFDLEQAADRLRLDLEWDRVAAGRDLVVLDEAQTFPDIFPRIRGAIDGRRQKNGRFLLLGSVSPSLMTQVSESLAGRLSIVELTPLLWNELKTQTSRDRLWLTGGFPDGGVLGTRTFPVWQTDYIRLLVGRDLPSWGLPANPRVTDRLIKMLAAVHGQLWNASQIGKSLGVSYHTVNGYVDYLVGAFLIRRLPPFHGNLKKRLVKSVKLYWRDSGILHALLNVKNQPALVEQPWVGASWEGFVIEQILGHMSAQGTECDAFHFRTSDGKELDLVLDFGDEVWAFEMKLTTSPSTWQMDRLNETADLIGAERRILISQTGRPAGDVHRCSCNLQWFLEHMV